VKGLPVASHQSPATGNWQPETGNRQLATGNWQPATKAKG